MVHPHSVTVATYSYHNELQTPVCVAIDNHLLAITSYGELISSFLLV